MYNLECYPHLTQDNLYTIQVFVGDQATCKNIRGGKRWSESEIDPMMRLQWANEVNILQKKLF